MTKGSFAPAARLLIWLVALMSLGAATGWAGELKAFTAKSLQEIRAANAGKPFVVAFWSLNCGPCKEEMALLKSIHRKYPGLAIALVSTDSPNMQDAINQFLSKHELGRIETWSFADDFGERVRFSVDRSWRGELPRTYFFDRSHQATGHSGLLDPKWVESWLTEQLTVARK